MPKVSVIIPVYNTEKFLRKCLDSVCNQTLQDIEIICINDCSTDGSLEILREYARKDKRIKLIELFENGGAAKARNIGIDIAEGEYLGFVDSDDFVDLDFYEKLYQKAVETKADAVKGELWEINDSSNLPQMLPTYDLNKFIQKNKAYFYFTFTTAIYRKDFIIQNNINFPEGLCHLEDPFFTIKAACYYTKITVVDNVRYYYVVTHDTRQKKVGEFYIVRSLHNGVFRILELINNANITREHYLIVSSFLLSQIKDKLNNFYINDEIYNYILSTLYEFLKVNKYESELFSTYYKIKRALYYSNKNLNNFRSIRDNSRELLLKEYKKLDYLNKLSEKPLLKALVGYIKPSFLFKSEILTPIHLGRAVEKEVSKDGSVSKKDIEWLHHNCIGDDDFEGNISAINRRVGFLTGTYWAWKNYNKLGDPEYFASFGYRKILNPKPIKAIKNFDVILPNKSYMKETVREQFINSHGCKPYNMMTDIIKKVYPDEILEFNNFLNSQECVFYENYILKKDLFFYFCEWIFPLLFEALSRDIQNLDYEIEEKWDIINYFRLNQSEGLCNKNNFEEYQKRIIGFIFERITGYFFHKLENLNYRLLYTNCFIFKEKLGEGLNV